MLETFCYWYSRNMEFGVTMKENLLEDFSNHSDLSNSSDKLERTNNYRIHVERYIAIVLCFASMYVFVSLLTYTIRNWHTKHVTKVNHLTVLSAFFSICLSVNKLGEQWIGIFSCGFYHWGAATIYVIGTITTYTVLWARQRKLYSDEYLAYGISRLMRMASTAVIIIIYFTISATTFAFVTRYDFQDPNFPCIVVWKSLDSLLPVTLTFMVMCLIFQFALYFLIVYPFFRHKPKVTMWLCVLCTRAETDAERMAKRLAFCLCACIISSSLLSVAVLIDTTDEIVVHWCNFAAIDLFTNTIATTCALKNWKKRLFGMFSCQKISRTKSSCTAYQSIKLLRRHREPVQM